MHLGFADLRLHPPAELHGIVVLRPSTQSIVRILELIEQMSRLAGREPLPGHLWIVEPLRVRIRS